jgi:PIN domain nuclease of toxin-antitoxin system
MKLLLDTCAIIWSVGEPEKLSSQSREAMVHKDSVVCFSPISAAEIACLCERGKIRLDRHWKSWFNHFTTLNGWTCVDITLEIMQEAYSLPDAFHPDPADRIIVATARCRDLTVVTGDKKIIEYPHVKTM